MGALLAFIPFILLMVIAAIAAPLVLGGWLFTFQALQPDFSRLDPLKGIGRIFSWTSLIELGKALAKSALIGGFALLVVWQDVEGVVSLVAEPLEAGLPHLARRAPS